jgi:hypothetical protein
MRARYAAVAAAMSLLLSLAAVGVGSAAEGVPIDEACPSQQVTVPQFADVGADHTHADTIACMAWWRIARGGADGSYRPGEPVTRAQMAAFVARMIRTPGGTLPASPADRFPDDNRSPHHFAINRLGAVGVVRGHHDGTYRPDAAITRGQMATFLVGAYEYRTGRTLSASRDYFTDDGHSVHQANIDKAAEAGFTLGVAPGRFAPDDPATRGQMASFLARTLQGVVTDGAVTDSPFTLRLASDLRDFEGCEEYLGHLKEEALERVGPYGLEGGFFTSPGIPVVEDDAGLDEPLEEPTPAPADGSEQDRGEFSDTNVQEEGVDEPDLAKTDGQHILTVVDGRLRYLDVSGGTPSLAGTLDVPTPSHELFLSGDRVLLFGQGWGYHPQDDFTDPVGPGSEGPQAVLTLVDVSDPAAMRVESTLRVDGDVLSSRMVEGSVRIVVRSSPTRLAFVYPDDWTDEAHLDAETRNREVIEHSTVADWVPHYRLDGGSERPLLDCGQVNRPPEFSGLDTLTVLTVDIHGDFAPEASVGVLAGGQTVYASKAGLYVATARWDFWEDLGEPSSEATAEIHAFDISDPATASYLASGKVRGYVLNQFSMSEHGGHLRVATTRGPLWWGGADSDSESQVIVLARQGDRLVTVGEVGGLGRGERIYAVRFLGDTGYVVTFREIDPLYVIDLSDPSAPAVRGELKILGYSAYLHPVGEGLLLGVGVAASEDGWREGTQVSLFDVSDPANPTLLHQADLAGGYSEVEYDHRAFLWWAPRDLAVLPVERWSWDGQTGQSDSFIGAVGYTVDVAAGISEAGRISHEHTGQEGFGRAAIRRSIVIGDSLYTVSWGGVKQSALDTFDDRAWVGFDGQ